MSQNGKIPLAEAEKVAAEVLELMNPFVERAEVAGSVRRRVAEVGDVDLVLEPSLQWDDVLMKRWLVEAGARFESVCESGWTFWLDGVKVELNVAVAETYPMRLLWMTGSKVSNIRLAQSAMAVGRRVRKEGVVEARTGAVVAWATEQEMFEAAGMGYVPPEGR